jgi:hypothetical protein
MVPSRSTTHIVILAPNVLTLFIIARIPMVKIIPKV